MTQEIDWDAAKARLAVRTKDQAVLDAFARISETGEIGDDFMRWVVEHEASLDWIFFDYGLPELPNARFVGRVVLA